ncbi:MAG: cysteine protease StiP family protein [Massilia sp.]
MSFSGSYHPADVRFLLKPLAMADFVDIPEKERLIASGQRHYSEMLSPESLPSARYLALFEQACADNLERMAADCLALAAMIAERRQGPVTLVSLARAGTPVGVILKRVLAECFGRAASHYSVSIIRDRGIDQVALDFILAEGHAPESIVFVDGWTGKGVIGRELRSAVDAFNARRGCDIDTGLYVLSDLAGSAACAASCDDYLIPSSILNATVSGLVSRSILNEAIGPTDFHGCVYYHQFAEHDQSRAFADAVAARAIAQAALPRPTPRAVDRKAAARVSQDFMRAAMREHGVSDANLVKPGIGEATRVLLRRSPRLLILRDAQHPAVAHLRQLAHEKQVAVAHDPGLPYHAVSLIRSGSDA